MKDLEGHPYVIAYAMQKIKARGGETTAAAHAGQRWIDQGIEIDVAPGIHCFQLHGAFALFLELLAAFQ